MERIVMGDRPNELWKPMSCCSEHFVSSLGRIARRSTDAVRSPSLLVFRPCLVSGARVVVLLRHCGRNSEFVVKDAVARAFIGPIATGYEAVNRNKDLFDNRAANIGIVPRPDFIPEEEWRAVVGMPSYEVSDLGRVRRLTSAQRAQVGKVLVPRSNGCGYARVMLLEERTAYQRSVHRLVAEAFIGLIPDGMEVDHISGDKADNRLANLQVVTHRENARLYWKRKKLTGDGPACSVAS